MSQFVRLEGKHSTQNAHCALSRKMLFGMLFAAPVSNNLFGVVPSCNLSPNFYSCMLSFFLAGKTREICKETQFQQKGKILSKLVPVATFLILQTKDDSFVFAGVFKGDKYIQGDFLNGPPLNMPINN